MKNSQSHSGRTERKKIKQYIKVIKSITRSETSARRKTQEDRFENVKMKRST
uniref:Uncharacterized protein n=1 Tax=Octopus bimaculoides TaxID=37653 RepID=A0A0L8GIB8_OCTBM